MNGSLVSQSVELNNIISMLKSFLNQISTLLAGWKEEKPVNVDVVPEPVMPKVNPMPVVPRPETSPAHISGLSNKRNGAKADDIWGGFRQGPDGNCVTVSAIKAAMHKFGQSPTDIYKRVNETARGYEVTMRDGFNLTLSKPELAQASEAANFFGRDRGMLKDAQFLFAVSCKRAQIENNDGRAARSFTAAIQTLNNGEDEWGAGEGFLRLGLKKYMKRVPVSTLAKGQVGMVNRALHSVAVIDGKEELWGRKGNAPWYGEAMALMG
ncbi:hypothetical protein KL786_23630 [Pseudomonas sp. TAE6080]|nr:hypothetical protein [Pseudomonas sp. TAE6080]